MPNQAGGDPAGPDDATPIDPAAPHDNSDPHPAVPHPAVPHRVDASSENAIHGDRAVRQRVTDDGPLMSARWRRVRSGRRRAHPDSDPPPAPPTPPDPTHGS